MHKTVIYYRCPSRSNRLVTAEICNSCPKLSNCNRQQVTRQVREKRFRSNER